MEPIGRADDEVRHGSGDEYLAWIGRCQDLRGARGVRAYSSFCQTEMWLLLAAVNGSRLQLLHRARNVILARRAIRSNSDGQT